MYLSIFKPIIDRAGALVMLFATVPVSLTVCIVLALANRGKVFFVQKRVGHREVTFTIYKFKTLTDKRNAGGGMLPDAERTFPAGMLIRRWHLDELPQLFNILIGDLSFIGPRPLLPEYLPFYSIKQKLRHTVKPGLTGLSQVLGGNSLDWNTRLRLDSFYAEKAGCGLDAYILKKTLQYPFRRRSGKKVLFSEPYIDYLKQHPARGLKP